MKAKFVFALFCLNSVSSFAQPGLITCTNQNNSDRSVSIMANSQAFADYTVKLSFTSLNGYTSRSLAYPNTALVKVSRGNSEIMKLTRDNSPGTPFLQYRFQYYPGWSFRKAPDNSFEYLLPGTAHNQLRVTMISSTVSLLSQQLKTEYRGTGFAYKMNDTICASRAGTVFECSDTVQEGEKTQVVFKRNRNRIYIEHRDGTLGIYGITAPIQLLVSAGDDVFPGQPLAVFNKESDRYLVYFSTCYLDEKKLLSESGLDNNIYFVYMPAQFYGNENDRSTTLEANKQYAVQYSRDIITAEMTKKEKRKFGFQ